MPFLARFFHITFFLISSWINHAQDIPSSQLIISQRISKGSLEQNTHFFLILPNNVPYLQKCNCSCSFIEGTANNNLSPHLISMSQFHQLCAIGLLIREYKTEIWNSSLINTHAAYARQWNVKKYINLPGSGSFKRVFRVNVTSQQKHCKFWSVGLTCALWLWHFATLSCATQPNKAEARRSSK